MEQAKKTLEVKEAGAVQIVLSSGVPEDAVGPLRGFEAESMRYLDTEVGRRTRKKTGVREGALVAKKKTGGSELSYQEGRGVLVRRRRKYRESGTATRYERR